MSISRLICHHISRLIKAYIRILYINVDAPLVSYLDISDNLFTSWNSDS